MTQVSTRMVAVVAQTVLHVGFMHVMVDLDKEEEEEEEDENGWVRN